jgi:hypothetical protein
MIRPARRATLLVAFSLLTSAATAYAECAWVLWNGTTLLQGASEKEWRVLGAYPAHNACQASHRLTVDGYLKKMRDAGNVTMWVGNEIAVSGVARVMQEFICLPDTVDPHRPKGK